MSCKFIRYKELISYFYINILKININKSYQMKNFWGLRSMFQDTGTATFGQNNHSFDQTIKKIEQYLNLNFNVDNLKFQQLKIKFYDFMTIEDIAHQLGKIIDDIKTVNSIAYQIYKVFQKDKKKISKTDQMYINLRKKNVPFYQIQKIKFYIENGKIKKAKSIVNQFVGIIESSKCFKQVNDQIKQTLNQPFEGSTLINQIQGLKIYQYPTDFISDIQKNSAITLLVIGQTGCGKSTFLNSFANYLAGIEIEDQFRYMLVIQNVKTQLYSVTKCISIYYLKDIRNNQVYRVIDTPGLGDTDGIKRDIQTIKNIQDLFKKQIDSVHLVLFLIKSSTTRVTQYHRYIFQSVMDLFDKSLAENFVFVLTFSDASSKPAVLESIQDRKEGFGSYWSQLKQPKTIPINNSSFFQNPNQNREIKQRFWETGYDLLQKLTIKAITIKAKSLCHTIQQIKNRQQLSLKIKYSVQKIEYYSQKQEFLKQRILAILQSQQKMNKNKQYEVIVQEQEWFIVNVEKNVTRCNNCVQSNCHENCAYGDGEQKRQCTAMDESGYCKICPKNCHYAVHKNDHILRQVRTISRTIIHDDLKNKYRDAKNQLSVIQNQVKESLEQYQNSVEQTQRTIKQMIELQKQLMRSSMAKCKPESVMNYLQMLKKQQQKQKKNGYLQKIQGYNRIIQEMEIQGKIVNNEKIQEIKKERIDAFKSIMQDPRVKNSKTLIKLLKKYYN